MPIYLCATVMGLAILLAAKPASACVMMAGLKFDDIKYASVVVVGRIANYEIVRDEAFRKQYKEGLERSADKTSEDWKKEYARATSEQERFLSDYARFNVLVDEVLVGQPPKVITVTWNNSTFGEPEKMKDGSYMIALRVPGSQSPPLRGPSATVVPSAEPKSLIVLQAPCAPAFIFEASSAEAKTIRNMLGSPQTASPPAPVCRFPDLPLPADFAVYAAGGYSGRKTTYQIDQSGHEATQIDVAVNSPDKPVVLILGAYEPTIWNIGWTKNTKILAVLASGYHRQVVAGLSTKTPLLISSYDNKGPCGYFYITEEKLGALNPIARKLFGRPVDMVYPAKNGNVVIGQDLTGRTKLLTSAEAPPDSYHDTAAPLAGPAGLQDAVKKGLLRKATASDAKAWSKAVESSAPKRDVPPIAGGGAPRSAKIDLYNAYVVLKPFTYPAGLYGAHSAVFLIPKGTPKPTGNRGHSAVYDFNTLVCDGPSCDRE
jgi:hypothetical protein